MKIFSRILLLASFILAGVLLAHAQQPSQSPAPQKQHAKPATAKAAPAKPAAKVWTDDDLSSLRTPADDYQIEQAEEKKAQEAAAQKTSAAEKKSQSGLWPIPQASTSQQADQLIAKDKQELQSQQQYIQDTQKQLATAPDSYKQRLQWRIKARTDEVNRLRRDISALEQQEAALAKKTASANSSSAPPQSQ